MLIRPLLLLPLCLLSAMPLAWAAAPPEVLAIERKLDDHPAEALRQAETALADALPDSDAAWTARLMQVLATYTLGNFRRAAALLPAVRQRAADRGDAGAACLLDVAKVWTDRATAGAATAETHAAAGIEQARRIGRPWCEARLQLARGAIHNMDGRAAQAVSAIQAALPLLRADSESARMVIALHDLSRAYLFETDSPDGLKRAIGANLEALKLLDPPHQRFVAAQLHHSLASALVDAKRLPEAREHTVLATSYAEQIGDRLGGAFIATLQAGIDLAQLNAAAALAGYSDVKARFAEAGVENMQFEASMGRARALLALGRVAQARAEVVAAEPLRARVGVASSDVQYYEVALDAHAAAGDAAGTATAAKAYAAALRERERAQNLRAAAEMRERFESERKEAENGLLRERQQSDQAQQRWLLATLALATLLLAGLCIHILQQRRLRQRLKTQAEVDELTGLPNRRSILETARRLAAGRRAGDHPACLAMVDIDHFKRVNDRFGHEAGDAALVAFAQACRSALRTHDVVGRLGGEEFLLVLPGTQPEEVDALFDRLRDTLLATITPGLPADLRLACSMGVAALALDEGKGSEAGDAVKEALRGADEALYRAKTEGRDRLALAA